MCGIFGFVRAGKHPSSTVLEGLKEMEYRGYDSWGVAVAAGGGVLTEKQVGKIGDATADLPAAASGLGHTRWATHGGVTQANAHPHLDCAGNIALIHNGIVENHAVLRPQLSRHAFRSETDSEVVVHLLEEELAKKNGHGSPDLASALMNSFSRLEGLSAIAALDGGTGEIVAAKNGSPLVIGLLDDGCMLASDPVALIPHTRRLIFLEDGQAVRLTTSGPEIFEIAGRRVVEPEIRSVTWTTHGRDLGPFEHFMIKEINEQPQVLRRLATESSEEAASLAARIAEADDVIITGCGTAHNAALAAQYLFSSIAGRGVKAVIASEIAGAAPLLGPKTLLIALSQSGETIDVLDACRLAQERGASVACLTNSEGSTLDRLADFSILLRCGPERCVLATKTYTAKLAVLMMAAYALAGDRDRGRRMVAEGAMLIESKLVEEADTAPIDSLASVI